MMTGDVSIGAGEAQDVRENPPGNRLALFGAVFYLTEWVAILAASPPGPFGPGTAGLEVVSTYADHAVGASFAAAWFAVVLLGRVVFLAGVKAAVPPAQRILLDVAMAAMTVSVVMEVVGY